MQERSGRRLVAITGAGGNIGRRLWPTLAEEFDLRLADRHEFDAGAHETVIGDVRDPDVAARICAGADTVIHLAADPRMEAPWESLLPNNIEATHTMLKAAADANVRRFVFASSVNASLRRGAQEQFREEDAPEPISLYGASKAMGESLCSAFVSLSGLSTVCIRIGYYNDQPPKRGWLRPIWLSPRDFNALARLAIEREGIGYLVVHGVSNNQSLRLSLARARSVLGYEPQDDAYALPEPE